MVRPIDCTFRPGVAAWLLGAALVLGPRGAGAQQAAAPAVVAPRVGDVEATARTAWIERELDAGEPAAQRWFWIWAAANAALVVGQAVPGGLLALEPDPSVRWAWQPALIVGAATSLAGLLPTVIAPLESAFAPARLRAAPSATPAQRAARLALAERLLRESAEGEDFGRSWVSHVLGVGVGLACGGIVWAWLARDGAPLETQLYGAISTLVFTVVFNEVQVLSQPTAAIDAWRAYRRTYGPTPTVVAGPSRVGAGLAMVF